MDIPPVALPPELRPLRPQVEAYTLQRIQHFAFHFARRINPALTKEQVDYVTSEVLGSLAAMQEALPPMPQQNLRLVLRHDCLSSGCGDGSCALCQYNPSRICKRNLKQKYLIDDHLKAKCGAGLRVEVVDENGQCMTDTLPDVELEVHVLNGEKYREVCPENTLLNSMQLRGCIITPHHKKPLLKRESALGVSEDVRIFLELEGGQAPLSDLQCTTSSEALLAGKAPTFRLLVWAIDRHTGNHLPNVTYVVSESFVVATKRVKHAIKSDIPSIGDHISKLVHIGKATVDKLQDIQSAASEENMDVVVPAHLNRIDKVGQFRELVEICEQNSDIKHKVRHLLKLSPEKWDEVCQHALSAVVPDFRPRVWWCPSIQGGLLFACKNGAVLAEQPIGYVRRDREGAPETVLTMQQSEGLLFSVLPKLKQQAMQDWFAPGHTGWNVYWHEPADPLAQQLQPGPNGPVSFMHGLPMGVTAAAAMAATRAASSSGLMQGQLAAAGGVAHTARGAAPPAALAASAGMQQMGNGVANNQLLLQQQQQQLAGLPQQFQQPQLHPPGMAPQQQQQQQFVPQHMQGVMTPEQQQQYAQGLLQQRMGQPASAPNTATAAGAAAAAAAAAAAGADGGFSNAPPVPPVSVGMAASQRHSMPGFNTAKSPFATQTNLQHTLSAAFPAWQQGSSPAVTPSSAQAGAVGAAAMMQQPQAQQAQQLLPPQPVVAAANGNAMLLQQQQQQHMQQQQQQQQLQQQQQQHAAMMQQQQAQQQQQQQHQAVQRQEQQQAQAVAAQQAALQQFQAAQQAAAASAAAASAAGGAVVAQPPQEMLPSLEMLNTDELPPIDRNSSLFGLPQLDSFQQNMQFLNELPSGLGPGLDMAGGNGGNAAGAGGQAAAAAAAAAAGVGAGGAGGGPLGPHHERGLSLKFSMSLDLAEVTEDMKPTVAAGQQQ